VLAGLALATSLAAGPASPAASRSEIRVPEDAPTLKLAIARAQPGDTIVLAPGTYAGGVVIPPAKHDLTIRGADRNDVVLDGADKRRHGILVHAAGVSILNLSVRNFRLNGLYWEGADRYRASYVTVWNVGGYGIYAEAGEGGKIDHMYVSGAADAAYYIGECKPCRATVANVVATLSAVGYSGTNSSDVVIRDSLWDRNGVGLLPNTYENESRAPQAHMAILRNKVTNSGLAPVPIRTPLAGFIGIGIAIAGGNANTITKNGVGRSERYGIAVFPTAKFVVFDPGKPEPGPPWRPRENVVSRNVVSGSGRADLALALGSGKGNCFSRNVVQRSLPRRLQTPSCAGVSANGSAVVAADLTRPVRVMWQQTLRRRNPPAYSSMPTPPPQPTMP